MNTILHKHFFAHITDKLVSELEVPAFTILENYIHPGAAGFNLLKVQTLYVYTLANIDNPPKHRLEYNTTDMNRVTLVLEEPAKLVPLYEIQWNYNVEYSAHVKFHLQPIKVIQRMSDDYRSLRDLEHLLEVEFIRAFRYPIVRIYGESGHEKAYLMLQYEDPSKESMMKAVIDSEQFKEVVLEYSPGKELYVTYGLNHDLAMPAYMAKIELDYNKIVEKYDIRVVD